MSDLMVVFPLMSPEAARPETTGRTRIGVMEEDPDLRRLFRDILTDAGFAVTFTTEVEGLPKRWRVDLVLANSGGTKYDRGAIERRIRGLRQRTSAPIILVSAHSEVMRDAEHFGADAVLHKPFGIDDLLGVVRSVIERR